MEKGFFTFDGSSYFSKSLLLAERDDVVWIIVPKQLSTGKVIAWPHYKSALKKLTRLHYHEREVTS
jgi:hypothetical protein